MELLLLVVQRGTKNVRMKTDIECRGFSPSRGRSCRGSRTDEPPACGLRRRGGYTHRRRHHSILDDLSCPPRP